MNQGPLRSVRIRISGRVQGVGFRAWMEDEAMVLGLAGWVRNRRDGSVEAVVSGAPEQVEEMIARCHRGPRAARVSEVAVVASDEVGYSRFEVWPTA
jgi:acylphosphatase